MQISTINLPLRLQIVHVKLPTIKDKRMPHSLQIEPWHRWREGPLTIEHISMLSIATAGKRLDIDLKTDLKH